MSCHRSCADSTCTNSQTILLNSQTHSIQSGEAQGTGDRTISMAKSILICLCPTTLAYSLLGWIGFLQAISLASKVGLVSVFDGTSTAANEMSWNEFSLSQTLNCALMIHRRAKNLQAQSIFCFIRISILMLRRKMKCRLGLSKPLVHWSYQMSEFAGA
jgi:hypothetical protein